MKVDAAVILLTLLSSVSASAIAQDSQSAQFDHVARDDAYSTENHEQDLWKRKGGGGRGGRGSTGGGSSGGGGGGGSRSGGGGSSAPPRGGSNGGRTVAGSGPQPRFGGGRYYGGGAAAPYRAGSRSPALGILPFALVGVAALAFWPGTWYSPHRVQSYEYPDEYSFYNASASENQTKPVMCGCADENPCSCDQPEDDDDYNELMKELIGDGSYDKLNKSLVDVAEYKGRSTILINGTLPMDTTLQDASADDDNAAGGLQIMLENLGYWPVAAAALASAFAL